MKSKHSPKHTSSDKHKKRKTTAQRDIPKMQPLEEEEESYDQPLQSQRLAQKRATKESHDIEETPSKKAKKAKIHSKVKSPIKETTKETKKRPRAPEKGVVIKEAQEPKPKKLEEASKDEKGKAKVHQEEPLKDKKERTKIYEEDPPEFLEPKKPLLAKGKEKKPTNFSTLKVKPEREVIFTSLRLVVKITFEEELKAVNLHKFVHDHVKGKFCPALVREFYSNAEVLYHNAKGREMIISKV